METEFDRKVAALCAREPRFEAQVYNFVADAVTYTVNKFDQRRHVSAAELLDGIREFAQEQFGVMAALVLKKWGIVREDDAGEVVFLLISVGLLRASADDSPDDFKTGKELFQQKKSADNYLITDDNTPQFII